MKRISEAQGLFGLIAIAVIAPLVVGFGIALARGMKKKTPLPKPGGVPVYQAKWSRGITTSRGTVWQYQLCFEDGRPYRTAYVIGNSDHTKFISDSTYPRGHETIDGERAKSYPTEQAAETALLAMGEKPNKPQPKPNNPKPNPLKPTFPVGPGGSQVQGGFGSQDTKPRFNF